VLIPWAPYSGSNPIETMARYKKNLIKWDKTPYRHGQRVPGVGVDCVRLVVDIYDEMDNRLSLRRPALVPRDAFLHSPTRAKKFLRDMLDLLSPLDQVVGRLEPGDIVVIGPELGGPGHAALVGYDPNTMWEVQSDKVGIRGWCLTPRTSLFGAFRSATRDSRWGVSWEQ